MRAPLFFNWLSGKSHAKTQSPGWSAQTWADDGPVCFNQLFFVEHRAAGKTICNYI